MRQLGGLAESAYRNGRSMGAPVPRLTRRDLATEVKVNILIAMPALLCCPCLIHQLL